MKVRIVFRSDIVIEGETMEQVVEKWQMMPLYSSEACHHNVNFQEIEVVEDANTYDDFMTQFNEYY